MNQTIVLTIETCHRDSTPAEAADWESTVSATLLRVQRKAALAAKFYPICHGNRYWQDQQKRAAAGATHAELADWISV